MDKRGPVAYAQGELMYGICGRPRGQSPGRPGGARAEAKRMRFIARVAVAAVAGAVIAWVVMAFILAEPSAWVIWAVGGCGALVASSVALLAGKSPLPAWVQPVARGSLAGVATVVIATLVVVGGPSSKGQTPYLLAGLVCGVPVGLMVGAVGGLAVAKRRCAEPPPSAVRPHD